MTKDMADLHDRLLAMNIVLTALIDTHPAPAALERALVGLIAVVGKNPLGTSTTRELSAFRAQIARRLAATQH